jgi:hypothetical protein
VRGGFSMALLVAVMLAACSSDSGPPPPKKHTLTGTLDALGDCIAASNGYEIVVTDENSKIVATTTTERFPTDADNPANVCDAIPFSVEVPERKFYAMEIGVHDAPTWSRSDLAAADWGVDLILNVDKCDFFFDNCDYLSTSPFAEA